MRDEVRARRLADDQCYGILDFSKALAVDGVTQQYLVAEVMACRIELEGAAAHIQRPPLRFEFGCIAGVDARTSEDTSQLLHIFLRIASFDSERVQFHQLAGVVLIEVAGGILLIVEVLQHRRMLQGCQHQLAEMPEHVRTNRVLLIVADQPAQIALVLMDTEMVEPEPHHLLLQLRR